MTPLCCRLQRHVRPKFWQTYTSYQVLTTPYFVGVLLYGMQS